MTFSTLIEYDGVTYSAEALRPGWLLWRHPEPGYPAAVMPTPEPGWSDDDWGIYAARVVANITGRCPLCSSADVDVHPVAPKFAHTTHHHAPDCPAGEDVTRILWSEPEGSSRDFVEAGRSDTRAHPRQKMRLPKIRRAPEK